MGYVPSLLFKEKNTSSFNNTIQVAKTEMAVHRKVNNIEQAEPAVLHVHILCVQTLPY